MDSASAIRAGRELNKPLRMVGTCVHGGKLDGRSSAVSLENQAVIIVDLKQAEDGADVLVRLLNPTDTPQEAVVKLDVALLGKFERAPEMDLMEREVKGAATLKGGKLMVKVPAFAVSSVRLVR
jgi:alpha-mannosidase